LAARAGENVMNVPNAIATALTNIVIEFAAQGIAPPMWNLPDIGPVRATRPVPPAQRVKGRILWHRSPSKRLKGIR
jgi:hypothetical protein